MLSDVVPDTALSTLSTSTPLFIVRVDTPPADPAVPVAYALWRFSVPLVAGPAIDPTAVTLIVGLMATPPGAALKPPVPLTIKVP